MNSMATFHIWGRKMDARRASRQTIMKTTLLEDQLGLIKFVLSLLCRNGIGIFRGIGKVNFNCLPLANNRNYLSIGVPNAVLTGEFIIRCILQGLVRVPL